MTSDEQMDALLTEAGGRWRAANTGAFAPEALPATVPVVDLSTAPRRPRWALVASAAAIVAALTAGGLWFANRPDSHGRSAAGPGPTGSTAPTTHGGLTGTHWQIFDVTRESTFSADALDASTSSASLSIAADGTITGSDGCNPISGPSTIADSTIKIDALAVGAMACTDERVGKIADTIDAVLSGTVAWHIQTSGSGSFLSIEHSGVGSLIYTAEAPPAPPVEDPAKMIGTWQLFETDHTGTDNSGSGTGASEGFDSHLTINADGTFTTKARCYANAGKVAIGTGTADFSDIHLENAIPCASLPSPDMQDEQTLNSLVDGVLQGATTWTIEYGQLKITKGGDTLVYGPPISMVPGKGSASAS